ncbi:MAG: hypothetical protein K0R18_359 [Bacillales bacterium]|jgi:hypothetical protein|nr:hypothetical protein [Bacillales bacterium]
MKPVYTGVFFDERTYNELKAIAPTLDRTIEFPHITLEFKPKELLPDDIIGEYVEVMVFGEGNDDINQGFQVEFHSELMKYYKNPSTPHITTSLHPIEGKAVNTGKLQFKEIPLMIIQGRVGYFTGTGVRYDNNL